MRPKPKHRPGSLVRPEKSPSETPTTDATADPYQIMESETEEQAIILHSSPVTDPGLSHSESSFEVVQVRAPLEAEPAVAPSAKADEDCRAILPVISSQSSCTDAARH